MTTSVIQDLENEDTSFKKRFGEAKSQLQCVKDWISTIWSEIHDSRSTSGDITFDPQQLSTDLFVSIKTTKKAIGDKRFEDLLSTPPIGWTMMGLVKSRKCGEIKAQYIKDTDYPISRTELVSERVISYLQNKIESLEREVDTEEERLGEFCSKQTTQPTRSWVDEIQKHRSLYQCAKSELSIWKDTLQKYKEIQDPDPNQSRPKEWLLTSLHKYISNMTKNLIFSNRTQATSWRLQNDVWEILIDPQSSFLLSIMWDGKGSVPYQGYDLNRYWAIH